MSSTATDAYKAASILNMLSAANVGVYSEMMSTVLLHWLSYLLASLLILAICSRYFTESSSMFSLRLVSQRPAELGMLIIALASAAGVPPFFGFWTKTMLLLFIGRTAPIIIVAVCWIIAVVALLFYINVLRYSIAFQAASSSAVCGRPTTYEYAIALVLCVGAAFLGDLSVVAAIVFL